ncbi:MAG: antiviral reverse transcriptase Drt3b [Tannerellaceae bacterium]
MKKRKKIKLKYGKERPLFSDVLPYETPLTFSNRYFYRFVSKYKWHFDKNASLCAGKRQSDKDAFNFASLLFGAYDVDFSKHTQMEKNVFYPFQFNIAHKTGKSRVLSVIHPFNQLQVVDFYEQYRYSILYLCSKSNYSLRKPTKVAQYFYYRDKLHANLLGKKRDSVELYFNEYENLKSYFSYQKYSNIYKFYEDYKYQRAEKKYKHLMKFDIQSCFDSIYTHSISWAVGGGRDNVKLLKAYRGNWVGDAFDKLMQSLNARETHGIVVGPEFSRIFAEIILQNIDARVEQELLVKCHLANKVNYECYRYVDDYFLFYNDANERQVFIDCMVRLLAEYKLYISPSKTIEYNRPFITNVTKAKLRINKLMQQLSKQKLWECQDFDSESINDIEDVSDVSIRSFDPNDGQSEIIAIEKILSAKLSLYIDSNNVITELKSIISEVGVSYNEVANYTLEILGRKIDRFLTNFDIGYKALVFADSKSVEQNERIDKMKRTAQKQLVLFINKIIEISFFIYSANRQVNTTLKLQKLLNSIVIYIKSDYRQQKNTEVRFDAYYRDCVLKKIQDELCLILKTTGKYSNTMYESVYLLVLAKSLGTKYLFSSQILEAYINDSELKYNLFICQVLLYYYGNHQIYVNLKRQLFLEICKLYGDVRESERSRSAELTILTADLMACPYLEKSDKVELLKKMCISKLDIQDSIINFAQYNKYIFTKWTSFDLNKELQAKISQEVYS